MSNIEQEMAQHLDECHRQSQEKIQLARQAISEAVELSVQTAELLDKVRSHYKSGAPEWIDKHTIINRDEARAYTSVRHVASKRDAREDKRALQLVGILNKAPARARALSKRIKPSPSTVASKASMTIMRAVKARPVASMSKSEREVLKLSLRDIASLYVEASR